MNYSLNIMKFGNFHAVSWISLTELTHVSTVSKRDKILLFLFFGFLLFSIFHRLGFSDLINEEPRRAYVALEMYLNGDWIHPRHFGLYYMNKPPVYSWLILIFYKIFGYDNEWVVRLPGVLSYLLIGISLRSILARYLSKREGLIGMIMFFTASHFIFFGTIFSGEIDFFFSLLILLQSVMFFYLFEKGKIHLAFLFSYLLASIAFLTKGVPAFLFITLTIAVYLVYKRSTQYLFSWAHLFGLFAFLMVLSCYFVNYQLTGGDSLAYVLKLLWSEPQEKFTHQVSATGWIGTFLLFPFKTIYILLPWSLILLFLVTKPIKQHLDNRWVRFAMIFILANLWIYWLLPLNKHRYLYPFVPFLITVIVPLIKEIKYLRLRHILMVGILICVLRIGLNYYWLPKAQSDEIYQIEVLKILEITEKKMPIFAGLGYTKLLSDPLGIFSAENVEPEICPYQVPFYLSSKLGETMPYVKKPSAHDQFYIGFESQNKEFRIKVYHRFWDKWTKRNLILYKLDYE